MTAKRSNPEALIQIRIHQMLTFRLPANVLWTASMAGTHLSMGARMKKKAAGVKRGDPDLKFLPPDGITRYAEVKTATGSLSREQRVFRDHCKASGLDIWALVRSEDDMIAALERWGVELKRDPFAPA